MAALTVAVGDYGLTKPLKDGSITSSRLTLDFVPVAPITAAMRRMVRGLDFDVCEMAFATYLCAKGVGCPITALPVFLTRNFHHRAAVRAGTAAIRTPKDLEGRRVAVNRGYTVTTGVWARGILQHAYGVDLGAITWLPTDEEHVAAYEAPPNVDYSCRGRTVTELLASGSCDAAVGDVPAAAPDILPLIPEAEKAGAQWFRSTGVYPLNHAVVVKTALLERDPGIAAELVALFGKAKTAYMAQLTSGAALSAADQRARALAEIVGDPFPFGIEENRKALGVIVDFAADQRVAPHRFAIDSLFPPPGAASV